MTNRTFSHIIGCTPIKNQYSVILQTEFNIYGDVPKWGRLRALPEAEEASKKELPHHSGYRAVIVCEGYDDDAKGHNGADSKHSRVCHTPIFETPLFIGVYAECLCSFRKPHLAVFSQFGKLALPLQFYMETYRSGHNGADSKSVREQSPASSNLAVSAKAELLMQLRLVFYTVLAQRIERPSHKGVVAGSNPAYAFFTFLFFIYS